MPAYPVIRDSSGIVLSLPPIINGDHSKVSTSTRNIFIESTATDLSKAHVVLDTLVAMLSQYCENKGEVEITEVVYENRPVDICPKLFTRNMALDVDTVNETVGISISAGEMVSTLNRMGLSSQVKNSGQISVQIPPTRHDIIHTCDIIEDVAIGFGYENIVPQLPPTSTIAAQNSLNKLSFQLANCVAQAGFTEGLTFSLVNF